MLIPWNMQTIVVLCFLLVKSICPSVFSVVKLFELLTVRGQQHSFSAHERMFLQKCQRFGDRKCFDPRGTWTPNLRIQSECSNYLSYQGIWFPMYMSTGSGGMDIFVVKLTFEMLTVRGQRHSFSTYEPMFLWKCRNLRESKCLNQVPKYQIGNINSLRPSDAYMRR